MSDFLGILVWYSIGADGDVLPVTHAQLAEWFEELKLNPGFLPPPPRGVEAFRAATSNLNDEWVSNGVRYRLEVREVKRDAEVVTRQLVAIWTAEEGPQERRVADLQFFRPRRVTHGRLHGTEKLKIMMHKGLEDLDAHRLQAVVDRAQAQYDANLKQLTAQGFRYVVRNYLIYLCGVSMRSGGGGTYFLPLDQLECVRALRELVSRSGPECRLMFTPMVDDPEQRDMIRDSVELDLEGRASSLLGDIADHSRRTPGRPPTTKMFKSWRHEYGILTDLLVDYGDMLDTTFERAADRLHELNQVLDEASLEMASRLRRR